ncbi:MAG: YhbY family RNA-binding protein, partial [Lactobacillus sp.]|nr:YhbY family RNA-binding protein [Lactobacillus sp.]
MLTGKQKRFLRSRANTMRPLVSLGKNGLSDQFVDGVAKALEARELVKISLLQ